MEASSNANPANQTQARSVTISSYDAKDRRYHFRRRAQQMQARKNGQATQHVINVARKMGKDDQLKQRVHFAMVRDLDQEQCKLWQRVLEEQPIVHKGETMMAIFNA